MTEQQESPTTGDSLPPQAFSAQTSLGEIGFCLCQCGVVLLRSELVWNHINQCSFVNKNEVG
jgi:hypothetical protein